MLLFPRKYVEKKTQKKPAEQNVMHTNNYTQSLRCGNDYFNISLFTTYFKNTSLISTVRRDKRDELSPRSANTENNMIFFPKGDENEY